MHIRRIVGKSTSELEVKESNVESAAKDQFLSNADNKSNFMKLLSTVLKKANLSVL